MRKSRIKAVENEAFEIMAARLDADEERIKPVAEALQRIRETFPKAPLPKEYLKNSRLRLSVESYIDHGPWRDQPLVVSTIRKAARIAARNSLKKGIGITESIGEIKY